MSDKYSILIDQKEFQQKVLDFIGSDEMNKMIDNTVFKDNPECKNAIVHGMCIASMLTSTCESIYAKEGSKLKPKSEYLLFTKPLFLKKYVVINEFNLKFVFENDRTAIYENDDVQFSFDKKVIRVLLYDSNNNELKNKIQDYFYEKKWKR